MLKIERLSKIHDRKRFDCGSKQLNEFLQKSARQHAERGISRTFVLLDRDAQEQILGFYTLTLCEVVLCNIPDLRLKNYPHPMPAAKLARLAVDKTVQGNGYGEMLLLNAMDRSLRIAEHAGLIGLFVDAKDERAAEYYRQYNFKPTDNQLVLYLPMATLRQVFEE